MKLQDFVNTRVLLGLALRRDRFTILAWWAVMALMTFSLVRANAMLEASEMVEMVAAAVPNPGMRLLMAPIAAGRITELGPFIMLRMTNILAVLVGLMSIQLVMRHSRHNEETGCAELLGSMVVGRFAPLGAALLAAVVANTGMMLSLALALMAGGLPNEGSLAAGVSLGFFGILLASVGCIMAQLAQSTRGAGGLAYAGLALAFLVNGVGNITGQIHEGAQGFASAWPSWLSPFGWTQYVRAYDQNNWWILSLFATASLLLAAGAFTLVSRRDVGAGILPAARGPARAARGLLSPLGLAWRLQKGTLWGWAVAILVFGLVFGVAGQEYGATIEGVEVLEDFALADYFTFFLIAVVASIIAIYTVQALLRMRSEEAGGPLESVLATAVSRYGWMASHIACGLFGTLLLLVIFGLSTALSAGVGGDELGDYLRSPLYHGAAVFCLAGFTLAAYGLFPRRAALVSWIGVLGALAAGPFFGALLELPAWVQDASPFSHVAMVPQDVAGASIVTLLVVGGILAGVGIEAFRRRDLSL